MAVRFSLLLETQYERGGAENAETQRDQRRNRHRTVVNESAVEERCL